MTLLGWIAVGWVMMVVVMLIVWFIQRRTGDAGIVDAAWTFGVGGLGAMFAMVSRDGLWERRLIVAILVVVWATRLGGHIVQRLRTMPEDGRYQRLKAEWGATAQRRLFRFFQFQALAAVLFAMPMLLAGQSNSPLAILDFVGITIWVVAIACEAISDRQLADFRADPDRRGRVCQHGLWRYSRHPNYFFEWLQWWSYVCLAVSSPWGWLAAFAPLAMLYLLLFVTGIPPTEAQALLSRGEAYREYQRTTNSFFPWFPKPNSKGGPND